MPQPTERNRQRKCIRPAEAVTSIGSADTGIWSSTVKIRTISTLKRAAPAPSLIVKMILPARRTCQTLASQVKTKSTITRRRSVISMVGIPRLRYPRSLTLTSSTILSLLQSPLIRRSKRRQLLHLSKRPPNRRKINSNLATNATTGMNFLVRTVPRNQLQLTLKPRQHQRLKTLSLRLTLMPQLLPQPRQLPLQINLDKGERCRGRSTSMMKMMSNILPKSVDCQCQLGK